MMHEVGSLDESGGNIFIIFNELISWLQRQPLLLQLLFLQLLLQLILLLLQFITHCSIVVLQKVRSDAAVILLHRELCWLRGVRCWRVL